MQNGKILVVGATGRVGGAAVENLLEEGFEVRALVRQPEKGERLSAMGAELAVGDATPTATLEDAVRGCSSIFSALAAGPGRGASEDVEYRGNMNLLSAARSAGVGHFVYSSVHLADHPQAQKLGRSERRTASRRSYWMRRTSLLPSCARRYSWRRWT